MIVGVSHVHMENFHKKKQKCSCFQEESKHIHQITSTINESFQIERLIINDVIVIIELSFFQKFITRWGIDMVSIDVHFVTINIKVGISEKPSDGHNLCFTTEVQLFAIS